MSNYHHLQAEERAVILMQLSVGASLRSIGKLLKRNPSTISREISRNQQDQILYDPIQAAQRYKTERKKSVKPRKLTIGSALYQHVVHCMTKYQWSPEQISGNLKKMNPDDAKQQVSSETIYAAIYTYPRNELKKLMIENLRCAKSKRGARKIPRSENSSLKIEDYQFIHNRPEEINQRLFPGHWEGDLIVGAMNQSCIGTLVERKTGYVVLCKTRSKSALNVREGFEKKMKILPDFLRLSMTYDRGAEMSQHALMSKHLDMTIYFADVSAPWQRGSNENTNGLLRQYFPKGINLSNFTQNQLDNVAYLLNTRPRKRFGFETPQGLMDSILEDYANGVALES